MVRIARILMLAAALALSSAGRPAAQPHPAEPRTLTEGERAMRNLALGIAALAALGLVLQAADEDREEKREADSRRLPPACLTDWPVRSGTVRLHDPDCLAARFGRAEELPLDCAVTIRSRGRFVSGFDPACLREAGWETPERD